MKSSHLDITHFEQIPLDKLKKIESRANDIVERKIDLNLQFIPRSEAESKYIIKDLGQILIIANSVRKMK